MGSVVAFERPVSDQHLTGVGRCVSCRHEWRAVAPVGVDWMQCPSCGLMRGRFMHPVCPKDGEKVWTCACGCDVFMILANPVAAMCIGCGTEQRF